MPNPLFNLLGGNNNNAFMQMMGKFKEFQRSFKGNPKEEVQRLLNSGKMSQEQFNQLSQVARQFCDLMK